MCSLPRTGRHIPFFQIKQKTIDWKREGWKIANPTIPNYGVSTLRLTHTTNEQISRHSTQKHTITRTQRWILLLIRYVSSGLWQPHGSTRTHTHTRLNRIRSLGNRWRDDTRFAPQWSKWRNWQNALGRIEERHARVCRLRTQAALNYSHPPNALQPPSLFPPLLTRSPLFPPDAGGGRTSRLAKSTRYSHFATDKELPSRSPSLADSFYFLFGT